VIDLQDVGVRCYTYETLTGYFINVVGKTHINPSSRSGCLPARPSRALHRRHRAERQSTEARDDRHLQRFQKQPAASELLIDELGFVPLSKTGAELLHDTVSQRHERASTPVTSNLPFEE
jgi:hypothetical protein